MVRGIKLWCECEGSGSCVNIYRWSKCIFLVPLGKVGALYSNL